MTAIKDLFASERGFFALILVVAASVLAGLDKMTIDQWREFSLYIFGIYVGGKTITGAVGLFKGEAPTAEPAAVAAPAATPAPSPATPA
jgi:hypothetical protein